MATASRSLAASLQFVHPTAGRCSVDAGLLAIRWRDGVDPEAQRKALQEVGVEPVEAAKGQTALPEGR